MQHYYLNKPDITKVDKSKIFEKLEQIDEKEFKSFFEKINKPVYLYWDNFKHKQIPNNFSHEEIWFLVKQSRNLLSQKVPIKNVDDDHFKWVRLSNVDEFLHKIDISSGGQVFTLASDISNTTKQKFLSRGIIEEA